MLYYKLASDASYYAVIIFAYMILVTVVGCFHALIASLLGDDTAKDNGLLTINPAAHVDPLGIIALVLLRVGWGRTVPVNPANITGRGRWFKLRLAMFSGFLGYLFIAIASLVALLLALKNGLNHNATIGFSLAVAFDAFFHMCIIFAAIDFVVNVIMLLLHRVIDQHEDFVLYLYIVRLAALLVFLIFGNLVCHVLRVIVSSVATFLAYLITRG